MEIKTFEVGIMNATFGEGVKVVKPCNIYGCTIGNHCFIGHDVMFINDLFSEGGPAGGDKTKWKTTNIGNHVSIGSIATVLPVNICDHVVIGPGAVVVKDITQPGIYLGNSTKLIRKI